MKYVWFLTLPVLAAAQETTHDTFLLVSILMAVLLAAGILLVVSLFVLRRLHSDDDSSEQKDGSHQTEGSDEDEIMEGVDEEAALALQHTSSLRDTIHRVLNGSSSHHKAWTTDDEHSVRSGIDIIYGEEEDDDDEMVHQATTTSVFELNSDLQWQAWEEFESCRDEETPKQQREAIFARTEL